MDEKKQEQEHNLHDYAHDIKGQRIHISQAESGRKGYFCTGCNREMQAKKGDIRMQHFAHDPKDTAIKGKCTYSDETERHKIAKEVLQILRKIKVPALYKYPPQGVEGGLRLIKKSWFIEAHTVRIELPFFENTEGEICWGKITNDDTNEEKIRELLIQPDISFFDENGKPILLIEVVATHKITTEKLIKIRRLGIDTIQVTLPKESPKEIENTFLKTEKTKWIYNYERENTEYILLPTRDDEGILPIDEFERELYEKGESFECKASQINNLIRGIRKCLSSESYRKIEQSLDEKLRRVKSNTERDRKRLLGLQEQYAKGFRSRFEAEEEKLRVEFGELKKPIETQQEQIDNEQGDLETRYFAKSEKLRKQLSDQQEQVDDERRDSETRYFTKRRKLERSYREYESPDEQEISTIEKNLEFLAGNSKTGEYRLEKVRRDEEDLGNKYRIQERRIEENILKETNEFNGDCERRKEFPERNGTIEVGIRNGIKQRRDEIDSRFSTDSTEVKGEFERIREQFIRAFESGDVQGISQFEYRNRELLNTKKNIISIRQGKSSIERLRSAKQFLESEDYKNWI